MRALEEVGKAANRESAKTPSRARRVLSHTLRLLVGMFVILVGVVGVLFGTGLFLFARHKEPTSMLLPGIAFGLGAAGIYLLAIGMRTCLHDRKLIEQRASDDRANLIANLLGALTVVATYATTHPLNSGAGWIVSFLVYGVALYFVTWTVIAIHELGHFIVAQALKQQAAEFCVGHGPIVWKRRSGVLEVIWRVLPFSGYVFVQEPTSWRRCGFLLFAAAGMIAEILLAGVILAFAPADFTSLESVAAAHLLAFIRISSLGFILITVFGSLVPQDVMVARGRIPTDGKLILSVLFPAILRPAISPE